MVRLDDKEFARAARQAIAEVQSRVQDATPGQLSLADDRSQRSGQLSLAEDEAGRLSFTVPAAKQGR